MVIGSNVIRNKKLILLVIFLVVTGMIAYVIFINNKADKTEYDVLQSELQKSSKIIDAGIENFTKQQQEEINKQSKPVNSVDDLTKIENDKQPLIGIEVAKKLITENKVDEANEFISFLMLRNDSFGIDASRLCYQVAKDDAQKIICINRATEQTRAQGIIKEDESLPDGYLNNSSQEQG